MPAIYTPEWYEAMLNLANSRQDISEKLVNMVNGDWMVGRISESNLMLNRPSFALSQYRTPIKGLYLCNSTTHPDGFITLGPGYNALQAIADDFDLEKWWVEI